MIYLRLVTAIILKYKFGSIYVSRMKIKLENWIKLRSDPRVFIFTVILINFVSFESVVLSPSHNRHEETLQAPLAFIFF